MMELRERFIELSKQIRDLTDLEKETLINDTVDIVIAKEKGKLKIKELPKDIYKLKLEDGTLVLNSLYLSDIHRLDDEIA